MASVAMRVIGEKYFYVAVSLSQDYVNLLFKNNHRKGALEKGAFLIGIQCAPYFREQ
jgi:hypothetical protein